MSVANEEGCVVYTKGGLGLGLGFPVLTFYDKRIRAVVMFETHPHFSAFR